MITHTRTHTHTKQSIGRMLKFHSNSTDSYKYYFEKEEREEGRKEGRKNICKAGRERTWWEKSGASQHTRAK